MRSWWVRIVWSLSYDVFDSSLGSFFKQEKPFSDKTLDPFFQIRWELSMQKDEKDKYVTLWESDQRWYKKEAVRCEQCRENKKRLNRILIGWSNSCTVMFLIKTPPLKNFFGLGWTLIRKGGRVLIRKVNGKDFWMSFSGVLN